MERGGLSVVIGGQRKWTREKVSEQECVRGKHKEGTHKRHPDRTRWTRHTERTHGEDTLRGPTKRTH